LPGGTLLVSRANNLFPHFKKRLEGLGFKGVEITGEEKDSLRMVINEAKPRLVLVGSSFYQAGTPRMMGQLLQRFPKLNIAAVSLHEYPASVAAWFVFHGVKSYLAAWEGLEEFHRGLRIVRDGGEYVSPRVKGLIDLLPEWPDTKGRATPRLMETLALLCNGFAAESIGKELHLSRKTVYNDMDRLCGVFNVKGRDQLVARAWELGLVTAQDMRFLDRRQEKEALPEWANTQIRMNREQRTNSKE
jgi:DNA-binding NarL/FixJ family response regulator